MISKQFQDWHTIYLPTLPLSFPLSMSLEQLNFKWQALRQKHNFTHKTSKHMLNKGTLQADLAMLDSANDNAFNNSSITAIESEISNNE